MLDKLLKKSKSITKLHSLIEKTKTALIEALNEHNALYLKIKTLIPFFNEFRVILGDYELTKDAMRLKAENWNLKLIEQIKSITGQEINKKLKYKRIKYSSPFQDIVSEWIRLYFTHKDGLFHYCTIPDLPRSNVSLEQIFSLENRHFRTASGYAHVGNMIRTKGGEFCIVITSYEPGVLKRILLDCDNERLKSSLKQFRIRQALQSKNWHRKTKSDLEITKLIQKL